MKEKEISFIEKDILKEVGNVCVGNAMSALEQVLGRKIEIALPLLQIVDISELPKQLGGNPEDVVVGLHAKIFGGAKGNALLVFLKRDAFTVLDLLIGVPGESPSSLTELAISALKELGNIIVSAYLSALGNFVNISAFPSTVTFTSGAIDSLVQLAFFGFDKKEEMKLILIEAQLKESQRHLSGRFFIIFESNTIKTILAQAKKMVKYDE